MRHLFAGFVATLFASTAAAGPRVVQGSALAVDPTAAVTWVVDAERHAVQRVPDADDGPGRQEFAVGAWPEQLVVDSEGRAWVSARQAGRIEVIDSAGARTSIALPGEPRALVLDEGARRLYVGLVTERAVVAIDLDSRAEVARQALEVEPWALARVGGALAVLPRRGNTVAFVDPCLCEEKVRQVRLPVETPAQSRARAERAAVPGAGSLEDPPIAAPPIAWFGQALAVAPDALYVVHSLVDTGLQGTPEDRDGYGGGWRPVTTAVTRIRRGKATLWQAELGYSSLPLADVTDALVRDGVLYVVSRGTKSLATTRTDLPEEEDDDFRRQIWSPHPLGAGLTGLAFGDDGTVRTYAAFDRELVRLRRHPRLRDALERWHREEGEGPPPEDWGRVSTHVRWGKSGHNGPRVLKEIARSSLGPSALDDELRLGRALFFEADDRRVSGSKLSCNTCHTDGRDDGLVWGFRASRRQTPVLTERLEDTAPFGWRGEHATLEASLAATLTRISGRGLPEAERAALARFLCEGLPPVPAPDSPDPELVEAGRQIFESEETGCASCHPAQTHFTDGAAHDVGSLSKRERRALRAAGVPRKLRGPDFDTPALRHLAISAPYLHDGSARTLEELVAENGDRMGRTTHLTEAERSALVAYLRSL